MVFSYMAKHVFAWIVIPTIFSLGCQDCLAAVSLAGILINFHFEARRRVIRIRLLERHADETKCEY